MDDEHTLFVVNSSIKETLAEIAACFRKKIFKNYSAELAVAINDNSPFPSSFKLICLAI